MKTSIIIILTSITFASCRKVYTCECKNTTANSTATNTSTSHSTLKDATNDCQQRGIAQGWQTCEIAEAK